MKSFDEWFDKETPFNGNADNDECLWAKKWMMVAYESRQAEVDKLQAEIDELQSKYDAMYRAFTVADEYRKELHRYYMDVRKREDELQAMYEKQGLYAFELQKRIDDLKNWCVSGVECNMLSTEYNQALIDMIKILKGGSND